MPVYIYYASETGTAERFYEDISDDLTSNIKKKGNLNEFNFLSFQDDMKYISEAILLIITSTFGEGDSP